MPARRRAKVTPIRPTSGSFIKPDTKFKLRQERHTLGRGVEIIGVTAFSLCLSLGAIVGLFHLARFQRVQLNRLKEINREVASMEAQVELQREKLARSFSTGSSQEAALRQQGFLQPDEMTIKLVERGEQSFPSSVTAHKD